MFSPQKPKRPNPIMLTPVLNYKFGTFRICGALLKMDARKSWAGSIDVIYLQLNYIENKYM
jgi:hypothetical protein